MYAITTDSHQPASSRHITPLHSYSGVYRWLYVAMDKLRVYDLWRTIFNEERQADDVMVDTVEFMNRVHNELFPLDGVMMTEFEMSGDNPLRYPIPLSGVRLPHEFIASGDLPAWQQAVVATIEWNLHTYDDDRFFSEVGTPPEVWYLEPWATAEAWQKGLGWLALGGPHWSGLARLIWISLHTFTNPFLGLPPAVYDEGLLPGYTWEWTTGDLLELAEMYQRARPTINQITCFQAWFERQKPLAAHRAVLTMLRRSSDATATELL